jgi:hypothetical protein
MVVRRLHPRTSVPRGFFNDDFSIYLAVIRYLDFNDFASVPLFYFFANRGDCQKHWICWGVRHSERG